MKILIIDDSYEVRDVLRLIIERHNLEVVEAVDGQDGLEKAKTHHPDLIIVDALMPRVDGFTFLRNIKKDPRLHSIPCVLFSAIYTGGKDRELALSLGAATFIAKPSNSEEFLKEIESILERKMQPVAHIEKKMIEDEKEFLKSYNHIVVAKLKEKVKELEEVIAKKKRSETIFKGLFESNPDAIVVVNHDGRIVSVNKTLEMLFGYNRDELIDNTIEVLVPECFRKQHIEFRNGYLSQPSVRAMGKCFGLFARRKDGNEFYADIMLSPVTTSEGVLVVGVIRDITERKRMEGEIKRLFAVIDQSVNVVFITNAKGNIEYVNSMFEQVTGYPKEEVIGRNPRMLASGETTHAEYAELWETITEGKTWRGVFKNKGLLPIEWVKMSQN